MMSVLKIGDNNMSDYTEDKVEGRRMRWRGAAEAEDDLANKYPFSPHLR